MLCIFKYNCCHVDCIETLYAVFFFFICWCPRKQWNTRLFTVFFLLSFSTCLSKHGCESFVFGQFPAVRWSRRCEEEMCVFEGLVAQDVTTPPLANEGDMNTGPGQQHTHTHWHGRNAAAVTGIQAAIKGLKCSSCKCVFVRVVLPGVAVASRAGKGTALPQVTRATSGVDHQKSIYFACGILRRGHMVETLFCIQRKVTLGVTCAKWQELGHTFTMASPFSCYSSTPVILFSLELRQRSGQIESLLFLHPSLRTPVYSLCLPICPISSGKEEELSRHRAFHFSVGDVANAVTVIWKSTQSELLLLLLKPSSSGLFMVMDNDGNFVQVSHLTLSLSSANLTYTVCMGVCVCVQAYCTVLCVGKLPKLLFKENGFSKR